MQILNKLDNVQFDISRYDGNAGLKTLICAIGYEERSSFVLEKLMSYFPPESIICFFFDDYLKHEHSKRKYDELTTKGIMPVVLSYGNHVEFISVLERKLLPGLAADKVNTVHVDYSSMPRGWYCKMPYLFSINMRVNDQIYFWYTEGDYQIDGAGYPSAGINDFTVFSGIATLRPSNNRSHVFGLGYDPVRIQAICTVVDPNYLVVCYSHPSSDKIIADRVRSLNEEIISSAAFSFSLPLEDFSFSVSKLREVSNELLAKGDVILIPNGPKPLILASSVIPDLVCKPGIVCLHTRRHSTGFTAVNVKPTGRIYGFTFRGSK